MRNGRFKAKYNLLVHAGGDTTCDYIANGLRKIICLIIAMQYVGKDQSNKQLERYFELYDIGI